MSSADRSSGYYGACLRSFRTVPCPHARVPVPARLAWLVPPKQPAWPGARRASARVGCRGSIPAARALGAPLSPARMVFLQRRALDRFIHGANIVRLPRD